MKKIAVVMMALMFVLGIQAGLAEEQPITGSAGEAFAAEKAKVLQAAKVSLPEAVVDYAVRERDDGRYEWDLFFSQGNQLGECEVLESSNEIRRVTLFEKPEGALTAAEAMARLAQLKGDLVIIDLELDREGGSLYYEGEAELEGKRYEFDMSVTGELIEWERD